MFNSAINLIKEIKSFGFDAYIVGGCVRDLLMNGDGNYEDIDIVTNIPLDILKIYETADISKNKKDFDVIIVEYEGHKFEVASFRGENIYEDLKNRDFTINALAQDQNGEIVGHDISKQDIENKVLRIGLKGEELFSEDPLRILRGLRFAVKYDLTIEAETLECMRRCMDKLFQVDKHRLYEEFIKGLALNGRWDRYINLCVEVGVPLNIPFFELKHQCFKMTPTQRFVYLYRNTPIITLKFLFALPNEVIKLHAYYNECCMTLMFENKTDYEIWKVLSKGDWNTVDTMLCLEGMEKVAERGRKIYVRGKDEIHFVSGKEVEEICGLSACKKVGIIMDIANEILMTCGNMNHRSLITKVVNMV